MPPTARGLVNDVFGLLHDRSRVERPQWTQLLEDGSLHVDFGDGGPVFLVTVEQVPRRQWTPEQPVEVGHVGGVPALLTGVTVDTFVHVRLAVPDGSSEGLMAVDVAIDDGHGTRYQFAAGEQGGTGTEREARQSFRPRPPAGTDRLLLTLRTPDGEVVRVPVEL